MDKIERPPLAFGSFPWQTLSAHSEPAFVDSEAVMIDRQPTSSSAHQLARASSATESSSSVSPAASLGPSEPLLTPEQASAYFGGVPSAKTLEYYRAKEIGPDFITLARRIYYRPSALDAYLDSCVKVMKRSPRRSEAA